MAEAPGHAHLPAIKILHHDNPDSCRDLAPRQLLPRHCAGVHLPTFCYRDNLPATYQTCTATPVMLRQLSTWTAKTRAIPLFRGKSGNTTSLYCRTVRRKSEA
jgi:hypothetical protein